jgi:hypothetical protein
MLTITLEGETQEKLENLAQKWGKSVPETIAATLDIVLQQSEDDDMDREITAYEQLHPQLKKSHLGQYVAIHKGKVVDTDVDLGSIVERIEDQYGNAIVLIRRVEETADLQEYVFHSVRLE